MKFIWMVIATMTVAALTVACGSENGSSSIPTPGATAENSPTAISENPGGVVVSGLDLTQPDDAGVWERLLETVPDTESTRSTGRLTDLSAVLSALSIASPNIADGAEDRTELLADIYGERRSGVRIPAPVWPQELADHFFSINTRLFETLGFDFGSLNQSISAGSPPAIFETAFGQYDAEDIKDALANCGCEQPDLRTYKDTEYFSWGSGDPDIQRRLDIPFYNHIGRGVRLLVQHGKLYYAVDDAIVTQTIDLIKGDQPSLASNDDYAGAFRWMSALGTFGDIWFTNNDLSIDEVVEPSTRPGQDSETVRSQLEQGGLLKPFDLAVFGEGIEEGKPFTGIVLVHEDSQSALDNAKRLADRLNVGTQSRPGPVADEILVPWTELVDKMDFQTAGRYLLVRIIPEDPDTLPFPSRVSYLGLTAHE